MSDPVEKRKFPRIEAKWPVTIITAKGPVEGDVRNISLGGVFIYCSERLRMNATYRLVISPPGEKIEVRGKLLWYNLDDAAGRDTLQGMGFSFVKVSEVHRELLREAIQKHAEK